MPKSNAWIVLKFGGSSVASASNWNGIKLVVEERLDKDFSVCMVHSALQGISDLLQAFIKSTEIKKAAAIIEKVKHIHLELASELGLDGRKLLAEEFHELDLLCEDLADKHEISPMVQAHVLAQGELMATRLGSAFLNANGIPTAWKDARELLQSVPQPHASTERLMLNAVCDMEQDPELQKKMAQESSVVLTQGFIARDQTGKTVLLGRGGSDVSAAYVAAKMGAERLEIWTDVPGLFSSNPTEISSARLLKQLSYEEAQEIATNGAHVLHPRCIYPARRHGIPIHVRCTQRPALQGTCISDQAPDEGGMLKTVAIRENIILVSMESLGMWQQVGFLAKAFEVFKQFGLSIDLISTSESNVTVSLDAALNSHFDTISEDFKAALTTYCHVDIIHSVSAVSLLGRHIRTILHQLGDAFEVFREHKIYLVSQASNDLNFTFVVDREQAERLVRQLHQRVISQAGASETFGKTWRELMNKHAPDAEPFCPWWKQKSQALMEVARSKGPAYVYSRQQLQRNVDQLMQLTSIDGYFYAMKANENKHVLRLFYEQGLGFECVSIGEVERVFELFPEIHPHRILFTPNFAPRSEYEQGLDYGVHLTLDNIYPLEQWPHVFEDQELFLRIDPGHGAGHHRHVKTGGRHAKFGIPQGEIEQVQSLIKKWDIHIKGLHAHVGSGIKDEGIWKDTALALHDVAEQLGGVEILDLGGGFGIREYENERSINLREVNKKLDAFKSVHPGYKLWVEPGRFLVATAGVLLAAVTQLKGKGEVHYLGIETGMNSFIRPALYGASHTIVNLSKLDEPNSQSVTIVGPICESADKLGIDRRFPDSEEGDIICIANAGAYGYVMSSNYNLRPPAEEIVI